MTNDPSPKSPRRVRFYRAYDGEGRLLHVGCTGNVAYTMTYNERHITWWKPDVARVLVEDRSVPRDVAHRLLRKAVREENPLWPNLWTPETWVRYGTARVYRAYDREGRLLYVGIAADLTKRLATHRREKAWWDLEVGYVSATPAMPREEAFWAEQAAIREERPMRNGQGEDRSSGIWARINRAAWWRSVGYVPSLPVWIDRAALAKPRADKG